MPGLSGPVFVERLREIRGPIPTLFISGYPSGASNPKTDIGGLGAFLEKPFTADDLLRLVDRLWLRNETVGPVRIESVGRGS